MTVKAEAEAIRAVTRKSFMVLVLLLGEMMRYYVRVQECAKLRFC